METTELKQDVCEETEDAALQSAEDNAIAECDNGEECSMAGELDELDELREALLEANIRAGLLMEGAAKEKLSEAERLVRGLCAAGADIESAIKEIMDNYPHLKSIEREIPRISAQQSGSADGFALIRNIFAKR